MRIKTRTQQVFLFGTIVSLSAAALMGIIAVIVGRFDPFWGRVLVTTIFLGAASILALIGSITHAREAARPSGAICMATSGAAFILSFYRVWASWSEAEGIWIFKLSICIWLISIALAVMGSLALAKLLKGWFSWVRIVAWSAIAVLVGLICFELWAETHNELTIRAIVLFTIIALFSIAVVPILERISRIKASGLSLDSASGGILVTLTCPRCKADLELPTGKAKCSKCGLGIHIKLEE